MIEYIKGDITLEKSGLIMHGVNRKGVMGSGVALAIRNTFPKVYEEYKLNYLKYNLGNIQIIRIDEDLCVANAFTQESFGREFGVKYANAEAIWAALESAFNFCFLNNYELKTVKIGAGLGGLSWEKEVQPIFDKLNNKYDNKVNIKIFDIN